MVEIVRKIIILFKLEFFEFSVGLEKLLKEIIEIFFLKCENDIGIFFLLKLIGSIEVFR